MTVSTADELLSLWAGKIDGRSRPSRPGDLSTSRELVGESYEEQAFRIVATREGYGACERGLKAKWSARSRREPGRHQRQLAAEFEAQLAADLLAAPIELDPMRTAPDEEDEIAAIVRDAEIERLAKIERRRRKPLTSE